MESMTGRLLVATPALKDPNFDRTVVLLVAHEAGGALGVVLNRATEVPVADVLGDWGDLARDPAVLFEGGPVQPDSAICLARMRHPRRGRSRLPPRLRRGRHRRPLRRPGAAARGVGGIRVFAGYSGWGAGQLEREIEERLLVRASTRCPATPSSTGPMTSGRWCCAARAA